MFLCYKILFSTSLIVSTITTISCTSWFMMWIWLEINLLSIIPLISKKKNIFIAESIMKYFLAQTIASSMLLFSLTMMNPALSPVSSISPALLMLYSALMMKMGMAPFHFWFPEVMEGLDWNSCLIMLTWQKIAPSCIMMYVMTPNLMLMLAIIMSAIISSTVGVNITSTRKIMAYSSINHMAWMMATMMISPTLWVVYFAIYAFTNLMMVNFFKKQNINSLTQLNSSKMVKNNNKMLFSMNLLSLGGIPPFIGFFPKWVTIMKLTEHSLFWISLIMIIFTLLTLFFYLRMGLASFSLKSEKMILIKSPKMPLWMPLTNSLLILGFATLPSVMNLL